MPGGWGPGHDSLSDTSHSSHSSQAHTPRRYSGSESESESGSVSWGESHPAGGAYNELGRPSRTSSMSSTDSSSHSHQRMQQQQHLQPQPQPQPYPQAQFVDNAVTPTTYLANAGFGSQRPTNTLMTDLDRSQPQYKTDDGEETPIGRLVNSFGSGPTAMDTRNTTADFLARQRAQNQLGQPALSPSNNAWSQGPDGALTLGSTSSTVTSMGPPSLPFTRPTAGGSSAGPSNNGRGPQKPQPHRLLTGANMPQPTAPSHAMNPMSGKPLFSAMVDLSGWLEEPVVPSPLYPTGPSLSSLTGTNTGIPTGLMPPLQAPMQMQQDPPQQQGETTAFAATTSNQSEQPLPQQSSNPAAQMPASRYWWANPPSQSDALLMHSVAQATATHLSHYPHLMVLPDPSSPVPPTVHRPWMAHIRGNIPAPLAVARVVLAGFAVRLPASEHVVWEGVARETQRIVVAHEHICVHGSDLEVFGATVALFFYCILLMMCTDAGATGHVTMELTNSAFFGLSQLSKSLSVRLQNAQNLRAREQEFGSTKPDWMSWGFEETMRRTLWAAYAILVLQRFRDGAVLSEGHLAGIDLLLDIHLPASAAEFEAGSEEEWRKARGEADTSNSESDATGESKNTSLQTKTGTATPTFTFRDLIIHRPKSNTSTPEAAAASGSSGSTPSGNTIQTGAEGSAPPALLEYFDKHDAFVATVLSIAFCLDSSLTT